jgi:RNA polymerase sigma-70 factor, ECF subfamily
MARSSVDVTRLLREWHGGDQDAFAKLMPLVYDELRGLAKRHMRRQTPGHTLQTTALLHEAYLKLAHYPQVGWNDRAHFFGFAARVMRSLLVDHARRNASAKRGGGPAKVDIEEVAVVSPEGGAAVLALNQALENLAEIDPDKARIVELRHFGGLSVEETAEVLGVAPITVKRQWLRAKAWLHRELNADDGP